MPLVGAAANAAAIIIGAVLGTLIKKGIPDRVNSTILQGLALAVIVTGMIEGIKTQNLIIVFISLVIGGIMGELIDIEKRLNNVGEYFKSKFKEKGGNISQAFVTSSLLFCVGAMAIMGALQSGLQNDNTTLFAKSLLDFVVSIIFGSTMGIGVAISGVAVLIYEGSITILAAFVKSLLAEPVIREMSSIGGILIIGIALNMLGITKLRLGNLLPAVIIPIIIYIFYPFA